MSENAIIAIAVIFLFPFLLITPFLCMRKRFRAKIVFAFVPNDVQINENGPIYARFVGETKGFSTKTVSFILFGDRIELQVNSKSGNALHTIPTSSIIGVNDLNGYDRTHPVVYYLVGIVPYFSLFVLILLYLRLKLPCFNIITGTGESFCIAFRSSVFGGLKIKRADADRIVNIIRRMIDANLQYAHPYRSQTGTCSNTPYSGSLHR